MIYCVLGVGKRYGKGMGGVWDWEVYGGGMVGGWEENERSMKGMGEEYERYESVGGAKER